MQFGLKKYAMAVLAAVCVGPAAQAAGAADNWPDKPVRLVVPFAAGGNTDLMARLLGTQLSKDLKQTFVIENVSGASGNIASAQMARAVPDGYTLMVGTVGTQAINPSLYKGMSEKTLDSFQPVTLFSTIPNVLVVNAQLPVNNVAELVAYARNPKNAVSFASSGVGSSIHLSGELFNVAAKVPGTHVPYRGSAPAVSDLMGGQLTLMFDNLSSSLPYVQSGKLKALAVTSAQRSPLLPNVPTMVEAGYPEFVIGSWNGVLAPAGTPPEIVAKLDAAIRRIASSPEFQERIAQLGGETRADGPEVFDRFIRDEYQRWARVIRDAKVEQQ
ncbi:Bug family tripartite tricarboxylate transporter substrate binding protein [Bordetella avium]|uniref:Bug family tripartite tricarboxylate transporter substrate binding protein n=1 Tax=Bordetella avium TaxID=521 RepID=UPI000E0AC9EF|nr:tripartite tricarboxylate transporter substrate binding protein [Bordetella avium]RIQ11437.1 tripartite tricarboxylate transporter substrate binding protein [Bordetella avium]RIQ34810.1 tripartite tricarboxylate transporter substrate binding protein [Bordetella avium]RIQ38228.1 tripartite tricarboxylate transporter substrate binding protein [Bordetella avium]RIQ39239.1 tripartite tricarboxylate transporter substrate binding protein [Bordetella avium]RIQ44883.1 tripartite tricarboxylate tran